MAKAQIYDASATVVEEEDSTHDPMLETSTSLEAYVIYKTTEWENFIESNFYSQWDEYYRLWRGLWQESDSTRATERSRIVTPALQQAVESSVAEIEEATFGHGKLFDIRDDSSDKDEMDVAYLRTQLDEDFRTQKVRKACAEVLINAAVYGTGVAELVVEEINEMAPATETAMEGQVELVGVSTKRRTVVRMKPIQMKNFRIDPVAVDIDSAHGVATDEFVPAHYVAQMQDEGVYLPGYVGTASSDEDIEPNRELETSPESDGKVRLLKYYGLVPRHLLALAQKGPEDEEYVDLVEPEEREESKESYWVEAIVVIGNEGKLLKAEESPYMMQDRPIVAFQWDVVPGLFWGRGVCEKGYNSQKALDAEIRARIDALALTIHPMLAMDATRIPRGHQPIIKPGKMLLTNGNPREILHEFNFGNVNQITFAQAAELQKMVQQSTGAVDGAEFAAGMGSNNKTGATSMALGGIIKRQKRTLLNFQEGFWLPFVTKAAWRYMQFDPDNYPINDYKFVVSSTLGIMAREYQVSQLIQLLQTTSDKSPMYGSIVTAIVENMNLDNAEELKGALKKASEPNPEEEAMKQEMHEMEMEEKRQTIEAIKAQAAESNARANKYRIEAELAPQELEISRIDAVADVKDGVTEAQFMRRLRIAEVKLSEKKLNIQEKDLEHRRSAAFPPPNTIME